MRRCRPRSTIGIGSPGTKQPLLPGPAVGALGDADHRQTLAAGLGSALTRGIDLAGTAVDQQQIRPRPLTADDARTVAQQRLVHGGVIVPRRDALDVVAPVVALAGALRA